MITNYDLEDESLNKTTENSNYKSIGQYCLNYSNNQVNKTFEVYGSQGKYCRD